MDLSACEVDSEEAHSCFKQCVSSPGSAAELIASSSLLGSQCLHRLLGSQCLYRHALDDGQEFFCVLVVPCTINEL